MRIPIGAIAAAAVLAIAGCGGDDEDEITAFCDRVNEARAAADPLASVEEGDIEGAKAALEDASDQFAEVAEVAPGEIQEDAEAAQAFFDDFVERTQDAETADDLFAAANEFQGEAESFQETIGRLETYTNENCGEDPADAGTDAGAEGAEGAE